MIKVDTGSKYIFRYDDVLDAETCDQLTAYMKEYALREKEPRSTGNSHQMPWHDGDTIAFGHLEDKDLKRKMEAHRILMCQLVHESFGEYVYPHFSDLVCWKPGKSHPEHKDNGYSPADNMDCRHYTSVTYCNDDFTGGETFVKNEFGKHFLSVPKKGSVVFYYSDERCTHGVNEVTSGLRVTMPTWFTRDVAHFLDQ